MTQAFGARLHVLRVVPDPLSAGWAAEVSASTLPEVQEAMEVETREQLDAVIDDPFGRFDARLDIEMGTLPRRSRSMRLVTRSTSWSLAWTATPLAATNRRR